MTRRLTLPASLLAGAILISFSVMAEPPETTSDTVSTDPPVAAGGLRAYLDPVTGRLIDHPPYGRQILELSERELYMFSTDHFGLIEQPMPDGGVMVNLQGRFLEGTAATVDGNNKVKLYRIGGEMFLSAEGRKVRQNLVERRDGLPTEEAHQ